MSKKNKIILISALAVVSAFLIIVWKYIADTVGLAVISAIEAYLFLPIIKSAEKKINRSVAIILCLSSFLIINGVIIYLLAPVIIKQTENLITVIPAYYDKIRFVVNTFSEKLPLIREILGKIDISRSFYDKINLYISKFSPAKIVSFLSTSLLIPVLMFYFLRDREIIGEKLMFLVPSKLKVSFCFALKHINRQLRDYIYSQFVIILVISFLMAAVLLLFKFDYWLILGIIMGIFNIIPYIGPIFGSIPIIIVASAYGIKKILLAIVLIIVVQQIDNLIIHPRVISQSVKIHPAVVLMCILLGNSVGSIIGMILAVPVFIVTRILAKDIYKAFSERNLKNKQNYQNNIL